MDNSHHEGKKGLLLVGDVDYDASLDVPAEPDQAQGLSWLWEKLMFWRGNIGFSHLGETSAEITGVKALFQRAFKPKTPHIETLRRESATEERFRRLAPKFAYLHLATHGFFFAPPDRQTGPSKTEDAGPQKGFQQIGFYAPETVTTLDLNPDLLSGLVFAGANQSPRPNDQDGILTAAEIAFLPVEGAEMITLSACETGLGVSVGGEGLLGVQRAFQVSGARSTVATLWKVYDLATRRLMEYFYHNLWEEKMQRVEALRAAQLSMLKSTDYTLPVYWAGFQLSGDWR